MTDVKQVLQSLKDSVGSKEPIDYFKTLTTVFDILFEKLENQQKCLDHLNNEISKIKTQTALSIHWESEVALNLISKQIDFLRKDKDTYYNEINQLKIAYTEGLVTKNYDDFVKFWIDTLGFHPFLE